jgi:hypothetical protein
MIAAIADANETLPQGTVFEIREKLLLENSSYDTSWGIAWYYVAKVIHPEGFETLPDRSTPSGPLFQDDISRPTNTQDRTNGVRLIARLRVEKNKGNENVNA